MYISMLYQKKFLRKLFHYFIDPCDRAFKIYYPFQTVWYRVAWLCCKKKLLNIVLTDTESMPTYWIKYFIFKK